MWSVRPVVTSNEVLLLTLSMQKLVILEQYVQWKNLVGMDEFRRNFGVTDIQHPFEDNILIKLRR